MYTVNDAAIDLHCLYSSQEEYQQLTELLFRSTPERRQQILEILKLRRKASRAIWPAALVGILMLTLAAMTGLWLATAVFWVPAFGSCLWRLSCRQTLTKRLGYVQ